ncbi:hypothetical protein [Hoeflea sp.]|uniref:hypothetical protein n=1 Tax=Hoeflea sp. TaxID=1940281 RepID=UPI003A8E970F
MHLEFAIERRHIIAVALESSSAFFGQTMMSHTAPHPASATSTESIAMPAPKTKFIAFLTAIGAIVLIGSEIWLAALAAIWAVDGFFDLAALGDLIMIALITPIALWATWMTAKLAISAEMNPENAD